MTPLEWATGPVLFVLLGAAAIGRLIRWHQNRSTTAMASAVLLASFAAAALTNPDRIGQAVSRAVNWPNGSYIFSQSFILLGGTAALVIVRSAAGMTGLRWPVGIYVGVQVAQTSTFLAAGRLPQLGRNLVSDSPSHWTTVSDLIVLAYMLGIAIAVLTVVVRSARWSCEGRGMALLGLGTTLMAGYVVIRGLVESAALTGVTVLDPDALHVASALAAFGLPLIALGMVWAPLERAGTAIRDLRTVRPFHRCLDPEGSRLPLMNPTMELDTRVTAIGDVLGTKDISSGGVVGVSPSAIAQVLGSFSGAVDAVETWPADSRMLRPWVVALSTEFCQR